MTARSAFLSRGGACAHLLRHLGDPFALRANPLVEHLFPDRGPHRASLAAAQRVALEEVRSLVRAAAEALLAREQHDFAQTHAKRQYDILVRCDLNHERHRKVADDLGLSLSQFYRERRAAREWVAQYLVDSREARSQQSAGDIAILDSFSFDMAHAQTLCNAGEYDRAIEWLEVLCGRLDQPSQRLEVYCKLVETMSGARRYGPIPLALQAARECFFNLRLSGAPNLERHRGRLELATAESHWANGDTDAAIEANRQAIAAFQTVRFKPGSDIGETLACALLDLVHGYLSVGRFQEGHEALAQARAVIDDLPAPPPRLRAAFLVALGLLQTNALDTMDEAVRTLHSALEIAQRHLFGKEAIAAMAGLSMHAQFHGDFKNATRYIRHCLAIGERVLAPLDRSQLLVRMLELEAIGGRPQDAYALASHLSEHFAPESADWTKSLVFLATALLNAGEHAQALEMSRAASEVACRKNDFRVFGAALRVHAAAGARVGLNDVARSTIERAVDVLESNGSPYVLLLSYEESFRITGNHRHALCARDLRTSVFRPLQAMPSTGAEAPAALR